MDSCPGPKLGGYLKERGFVDVVEKKFVLPVGTWPADKQLVSSGIGSMFHELVRYTE